MKERTVIKYIVGFMFGIMILATQETDLIFVGASVLFFLICVVYTEWCERL